MTLRQNSKIAALLGVFLLGCPTKDPLASDPNCPADAPCFLSVVAPRGQTAAPGPYSIVVEVIGPHRIEGVGLVLSINGGVSQDLRLARLTNSRGLWGVPDLEDTDIEPPEAKQSAEALARLQPGDQVTFLLWSWDQMGNQTQWKGSDGSDANTTSFDVVDETQGSQLPDAGLSADAAVSGDAGLTGDAGSAQDATTGVVVDAAVNPPSVDAG